MTTMWKPGESKPHANDQQQRHVMSTLDPTSSKNPAKKLSSATMGMRFMQRKSLDPTSTSPSSSNRLNGKHAKSRTNEISNQLENSIDSHAKISGLPTFDRISSENGRKRDIDTITTSTAKEKVTIILEIATVVDMYGQGSDIIGRRSFGGFRKSVRATWDEALQKRANEIATQGHTKDHISDEELLKRYERYVKNGREKAAAVSDSARKEKKKKP